IPALAPSAGSARAWGSAWASAWGSASEWESEWESARPASCSWSTRPPARAETRSRTHETLSPGWLLCGPLRIAGRRTIFQLENVRSAHFYGIIVRYNRRAMPEAYPRRGRPPKYGRPSRPVTVTLPEDVLSRLHRVDADVGRAIVTLVERQRRAHADL